MIIALVFKKRFHCHELWVSLAAFAILPLLASFFFFTDQEYLAFAEIIDPVYVDSLALSPLGTSFSDVYFNTDGTRMFLTGQSTSTVTQYLLSSPFDVSTAIFAHEFDVLDNVSSPQGIAFNTDGTRMFLISTDGFVYQYSLSSPFDVSTAKFVYGYDLLEKPSLPRGISFNTDGTRMFLISTDGFVYQYSLSSPFDVQSLTFDYSFVLFTDGTPIMGMEFNKNGTRMFLVDHLNGHVSAHSLSFPFDIESLDRDGITFDVSGDVSAPYDISFDTNGNRMYVVSPNTFHIAEYMLSAPYDISSPVKMEPNNFDGTGLANLSENLAFNTDGTKMFLVGASNDFVTEHNLSIPFDISTASRTEIEFFDVSFYAPNPYDVGFNPDGTQMYIVDAYDMLYQYSLSAPFDISTVSEAIPKSFDISSHFSSIDTSFSNDGSKVFVLGHGDSTISQYSLSAPFDISTVSESSLKSSDISIPDRLPMFFAFSTDGTQMFVTYTGSVLYQYSLSAPFDISTLSESGIRFLDNNNYDLNSRGIEFSTDGTKMFLVGLGQNSVHEYDVELPMPEPEPEPEPVQLTVGRLSWNADETSPAESVRALVIDHDMNLNPQGIDTLEISVSSNSDKKGIVMVLSETDVSTGVFYGFLSFTDSGTSSENTLLVSDDDVVVGKYVDSTLPDSFLSDSEDVKDFIKITKQWGSEELLDRMSEDGIVVDLDDADKSFSTIESLTKTLDSLEIRYSVEKELAYENREISITKKIEFETDSPGDFEDVFGKKPKSFLREFNGTSVDDNFVLEKIKGIQDSCTDDSLQYCQEDPQSLKDKIMAKIGKHTVHETIMLKETNRDHDHGHAHPGLVPLSFHQNNDELIHAVAMRDTIPVYGLDGILLPFVLLPNATAQSIFDGKKISEDIQFLNGFTLGYGFGKTWSYEYDPGFPVFYVEAHAEVGLGIGFRVPISVSVDVENAHPTADGKYNALFAVNTNDLDDVQYGDLLEELKVFEGKEFNTYLGPAVHVDIQFFGVQIFEREEGLLQKPEGADFAPPLGDAPVKFTQFDMDLCDQLPLCYSSDVVELGLSAGIRGDVYGNGVTLDSVMDNPQSETVRLSFERNNSQKGVPYAHDAEGFPGMTLKNIRYDSNLHFVPVLSAELSSQYIPFYSISESVDLPGISFSNIILESHDGTIDEFNIGKNKDTFQNVMSDGTVVSIDVSAPSMGHPMSVDVAFEGQKHVNYDIVITQDGHDVLNVHDKHGHDGTGSHFTNNLFSSNAVDIVIFFQGYGMTLERTGPIGERIEFLNVIPEFGVLALVILAVAFASVTVIGMRSGLSLPGLTR